MTNRRRMLIMGISVLVAACQSGAMTTTTVSVAPPSTVSTTTSTTIGVDEQVGICARGLPWGVGTTYVAHCFVHPMSFMPQDEGWVSSGATESHVRLRWNDPTDRDVSVRIALIAYRVDRSPAEVLESILDVEGVSSLSGAEPVEVVGVTGIVAELEGAPEENAPIIGAERDQCTTGSAVWMTNDQFGHGFFPISQGLVIGVGACDLVQAWIVDVDGLTLTILAGTEDPASHPAAIDAAERLFASMVFGSTP